MGHIEAGRGGERWYMLESVLERLDRSVMARASAAWLLHAWPMELEQDEVRDQVWRAWAELGDEFYEGVQWLDDAVGAVSERALMHGIVVSEAWRGQVMASLVWAWQVSTRRGVGWERVSVEVCDGVQWPGVFVKSAPGKRSANGVQVVALEVLGGAVSLVRRDDHEAGYWVVRASMMPMGGAGLGFDGEAMQAFLRELG